MGAVQDGSFEVVGGEGGGWCGGVDGGDDEAVDDGGREGGWGRLRGRKDATGISSQQIVCSRPHFEHDHSCVWSSSEHWCYIAKTTEPDP